MRCPIPYNLNPEIERTFDLGEMKQGPEKRKHNNRESLPEMFGGGGEQTSTL